MLLGCWFVKLDLQYYHIMVCRNTELQYSVIQLLRKHQIDHCLSLLMLLLWCYFYVHFYCHSVSHRPVIYVHFHCHSVSHRPVFYVHFLSFSESSSCFLCTFSFIQWVIVLFFMYIFSHSVSHGPVFMYIFIHSGSHRPVFLCTFSVIQWVIVLFWGISWWLVGVYNYNCLVYFQNLRNPVPCMEVSLEEYLV
jgi:hypothetical protein